MELYLDSADLKEIEEAFKLGFLTGLTTTPSFMHREGITDIDSTILKLAGMVPVLQVEALGQKAEDICQEVYRLIKLGLDIKKSVFKIPVSLEGVKACKKLTDEGIMVNIHLVYTLQQAYMAMAAGATYVCPLVGRLQDQGHEALALIEECVNAVNFYGYDTKIMFSSVRNPEHVRNAINLGADACTIPWKVMKMLTENNFTTLGTEQFFEHTRLMTYKVKDVIRESNPVVKLNELVADAIVKMTESGLGAVTIVDDNNNVTGIFTDGDLRRYLQKAGKTIFQNKMSEYASGKAISIDSDSLLIDASDLFKKTKVDNIVVVKNNKPIGMLDIQDLVKTNLGE
jgi:transaldolase